MVKGLFSKYEEIPEDWKVTKIGDNSDSSAGGTPSRLNYLYWGNGTVPWISSGEIKNNLILTSREKITELGLKKSAAKIFPKGSILLAITGQGKTRGRTGLLGIDSSTNQSVVGIKTHDGVSNYYLWYYLQNQYNRLRSISQGSNQGGLNLKLINNYKVFLPLLHEQQKIASILSRVDALMESTQHIIEKTERFKKGLMQKLLTRGIGHVEFKKIKNFFQKNYSTPYSWEHPKFASLVKVNPRTSINTEFAPYVPMDAVNINSSAIRYFEHRKVADHSNLPRFVEHDVLFARITPSTENGKTALIEHFQDVGIASSELTILRPNDKILPKYLYYYMKSHRIRSFAISQMLGTTNRQRVPEYVFKQDLNFELPPLSEQQKIASILSGVDAYIQKNQQYKEKLEKLKKGLMQKLLTGKIRVPLS